MSTSGHANGERIFIRTESSGPSGSFLILAGIAGLCVAVAGLALAIVARVGQLALQAMTTLPALVGIGTLTAGWTLLRTPRRVSVDRDGLTIETKNTTRRLGWDDIGCAVATKGSMSHRRYLNITDPTGKSIVKLDESFSRFDEMVALISSHVEAKGDDTAYLIVRKKARRQATLTFVTGFLMAIGCIFIVWMTRAEQRASRLLDEKGEKGEAEIVAAASSPQTE